MKKQLQKLVKTLETSRIKPHIWIITFFSLAFIRNFFEGLLENTHTIGTNKDIFTSANQMFMVYNLEWATLVLAVILILTLFTGEKISNILNLSIFFLPLIITVPFIDFAVYFPEGNKIEYLTTSSGYAHSLASFFIPWKDIGISAGVRLEVLAAVLMVAVYIHLKTGSLLKAAGGSIAVYFFAVSSMCFPVFFLLPAAIVFPLDFDIIINSFLNDCPVKCTLLNRISLMILFLLTAYTVIAFYLYDKKNVFFLLRNTFFHKLSFVFPVLYLLGFITASVSTSVINDCPFFQSTFAWFYLLSGLLFSFLIAGSIKLLINSSFSFPAVFLIIVFLFPHLFSINISYSVFMCSLAAGCIAFLLFKSPFAGMFYKKTVFPFLFSFIYVIIFLAGFSSIAGVSSPASLPFVIIFCIYAAFFIYHYLSASVKLKK